MTIDFNPVQAYASNNLTATAVQGSKRSMSRMNEAAQRINSGELTARNVVTMKEQSALYSMNMKMIKVADETVGQLLNLRG